MGIAIPQVVTEDRASSALSVDGSLRFNGTNQYLRKTFSTEGNRQVFTWSCWVKRNELDTWQRIFTCEPSSNNIGGLSFRDPDSKIRLQQQDNAGAQGNNHLLTVPSYRDISGFYHVVMAVDTVNATAADRFKIYVNGERQSTTWDTGGNPAQLSKLFYNSGDDYHEIGHSTQYNAYQKGQMAQCYWIDGLQLEPSEFGFTDPLTNTWRPKKYTGSFSGSLTSVPTSTSNVAQSGSNGNTTPAATLLFGMPGPTSATSHIRQDGGGIEWSPAITLSNDVAGAECVYLNNTSTHNIEFKIDGNWVTAQTNANTPIGTTAYGALITLTTSGSWTGVRATGGSNVSVTGVTGIFVNGVRQYNTSSNNGFYLPMDGSAPIGEDQSGNGNDFTPIYFGGSAALDKATGAKPILNTLGGTIAKSGVFGSEVSSTIAVTVSNATGSNKYYFDTVLNPTLALIRGATITFDTTDSSNNSHPFKLSSTNADSSSGTEYTDGVAYYINGSTVSGSDYVSNYSNNGGGTGFRGIKWTIPHNVSTTYYYCTVHAGMGNNGRLNSTTDETKADPYAWKCILALPLTSPHDVSGDMNCTTTNDTITNNSVAFNSDQSIFYNLSADPDGGQYLSGVDLSSWDIGQPWTIEFWWYRTGANTNNHGHFVGGTIGGTNQYGPTYRDNHNPDDWQFNYKGQNVHITPSPALRTDVWEHHAFTSDGNNITYFRDGVFQTTASAPGMTGSWGNSNEVFRGGAGWNSQYVVGHVCDMRVYTIEKYTTAGFIPAATNPDILPDSPSGVSTKTQLTKIPSSDSNTLLFPTQGSKIVLGNQYTPIDGTGDYTISFWFFASEYNSADNNGPDGGFDYILTQAATHPTYPIGITISKAGKIVVQDSGNFGSTWLSTFDYAGSYDTNNSIVLGQWSYVHIVRSSGTLSIYNNGNLQYSRSQSSSSPTPTGDITICLNTGSCFVKDFRIEGAAITDPTPPTGSPTATGNTRLLLDGLNDVSGNNVALTVTGDVQRDKLSPFITTDINTVRGQEGNYCTWNPLTMSRGNILEGNLLFYGNGTNTPRINGTISQSSGKWYYEVTVLNDGPGTGSGDVHNSIGWGLDSVSSIETAPNTSAMQHSFYFMDSGYYKNFSGSNTNSGTGKWLAGDVIGVAADLDNNTLTFYKNNIEVLSATIGTTAGTPLCPAHQSNTGNYGRSVANFGQKPFKFAPPDGYQPLSSSTTRPDDVISRPDQYFAATKYDGNTDSSQDIDVGFAPDLVWQKIYSQAGDNALTDTVRGVNAGYLQSEDADKEKGNANDGISAFLPNGFRAYNSFNNNGLNWISWCWKAGGSGSQPFYKDDVGYATAAAAGLDGGSITPIGASVGTKQGFSIVTYTANLAEGGATISHGLTQKPDFAIFKNRDSTLGVDEVDWGVYHSGIGALSALELNQQLIKQTYPGPFNNTEPTSSLFSFGGQSGGNVQGHSYLTNGPAGNKFIAYIWHNVPGLQKFGVYDGTGSGGTSPFIELGFRPALVWLKSFEGSTSNWVILDDKRPGYNSELQTLCANLNNGHNASGGTSNDILSNGFKIRGSSDRNASNTKYIYCAWAASPFSNLYGAQSNAG